MSLKIAYLFYDRPNYTAGPLVNARRLLPELVRRGYRVTALIGYRTSCPSQEFLQENGVEVHALEWPEFVEDQVAWLYARLNAADPDIFVPYISASGCYAARCLREAGRPTVAAHQSDDLYNWSMAERFCLSGDDGAYPHWSVSAKPWQTV